jgi:hypothetical protein
MIRLAACWIRLRQYLRLAAGFGHAEQARRRISRGEHNCPIRSPARAARKRWQRAQRDGRPTSDRDLLELASDIEEADPAAIGRDERSGCPRDATEGRRVELIDRAQHQLPAFGIQEAPLPAEARSSGAIAGNVDEVGPVG